MNASELIIRVNNELNAQGIKTSGNTFFQYWSEYTPAVGEKYIVLEQTYRSNGTEENVTATISVHVIDSVSSVTSRCFCAKRIAKVKVPKDASDKVISKRVAAAIEAMNA